MSELDPLHRLARLYGVLTEYTDGFGKTREASPETLTAVLRELGAEIAGPSDAPAAIRARRRALWSEPLEPVSVVWQGSRAAVRLRLPGTSPPARLRWDIALEDGGRRGGVALAANMRILAAVEVNGEARLALQLSLPGDLPTGRHRLRVEAPGLAAESLLLAAPARCHRASSSAPGWGVFLPLYALRTSRSPDVADLTDLANLATWTRDLGGSVVGTLPLLAAYLDEPFEPSPYAPVSRRFWNEFYVDPRATPEWETSAEARRLFEPGAPSSETDYVDFRSSMAYKRRVLEALAEAARPAPPPDADLEGYARFRAVVETRGANWESWPAPMRDGRISPRDYDEKARGYHVYVQRQAEAQLADVAEKAGSPGLYLDLPLGTHAAGFDVWSDPESFARGVAGGAPPDRFFTKGQDWGFAPLHPEHVRGRGHDEFAACLRHHLRHAGMLRVDHFMGLHRLYWIPRGAEASEGTYVRYPAQELYATLCLESQRAQARIVGEDLGTVPETVRERMRDHAVDRMYVAQFEFRDHKYNAQPQPDRAMTAGVNTHDTPTFATYWQGLEIDDQVDLELLDETAAAEAREARERRRKLLGEYFGSGDDSAAALRACLRRMARSDVETVLVNLEDLWGETRPQNTPGTYRERPNWKRRAKLDFETMQTDERVAGALRDVDAQRKRAAKIRPLRERAARLLPARQPSRGASARGPTTKEKNPRAEAPRLGSYDAGGMA